MGFDSRPRLVKRVIAPSSLQSQSPSLSRTKRKRTGYHAKCLARITKFQRWFSKVAARDPDFTARVPDLLVYYREQLASDSLRTRPIRRCHRRWIFFNRTTDLAVWELCRLEWTQHCPMVVWSLLELSELSEPSA